MHPTQRVEIFRNVSTPLSTLAIHWTQCTLQNFTDIVLGEPLHLGETQKGSDVGHVQGYISEIVQDTASNTIND